MGARNLKYDLSVNGKSLRIELLTSGELLVDGERYAAGLTPGDGDLHTLNHGQEQHRIYLRKIAEHHYEVWIKHHVLTVDLSDERDRLLATYGKQHSSGPSLATIRAPMPGIVAAIRVKVGELVQSGDPMLILEAMKMENEIRSSIGGKVKAVLVAEKTPVEKDQALVTIEPA